MVLGSPRSGLTSDGVRQELQRFATEFAKGQLHEELQVLGNRIEEAIHQAIRPHQDELAATSPVELPSSDAAYPRLLSISEDEEVVSRSFSLSGLESKTATSSAFNGGVDKSEELGWFHRPRRVSMMDFDMDARYPGRKRDKDRDERPKKRVSLEGGENEDETVNDPSEGRQEVHSFILRHRKSYYATNSDNTDPYQGGSHVSSSSSSRPTSLHTAAGEDAKRTSWWAPTSRAAQSETPSNFGYIQMTNAAVALQSNEGLIRTGTETTDESSVVDTDMGHIDSGKARWGRPTGHPNNSLRASTVDLLLPLRFEQRTRLADVVGSSTYAYLSGCIICASAVFIGVQTDYKARHWVDDQDMPRAFRMLDQIFCVLFVVDIFMRLGGLGLKFWSSQDWRWNILDLIVTVVQVTEEIVSISSGFAELEGHGFGFINILRTLRIFRMIRVLRLVRIARVLNLVGELRMILVSVMDGLTSLCWTVMVVILVVYVVGVYLTQTVTDLKVKDIDGFLATEEKRSLEEFFGTLDRSMLSLYEAISDGIHWHEIIHPLRRCCSPLLVLLFVGYIAFSMFAMLNVVTGVFVESAIQAANDDKKKVLMYQIRSLFMSADTDESGTITWEEFKRILGNEQMQLYLRAIDLGEEEARELFRLLDIDDRGEIEFEEFVNGCLRLHGLAKSLDLAAFMHEYRRSCRVFGAQMQRIESKLTRVLTYTYAGNPADRATRPASNYTFGGREGESTSRTSAFSVFGED